MRKKNTAKLLILIKSKKIRNLQRENRRIMLYVNNLLDKNINTN